MDDSLGGIALRWPKNAAWEPFEEVINIYDCNPFRFQLGLMTIVLRGEYCEATQQWPTINTTTKYTLKTKRVGLFRIFLILRK